MTKAKVQTDEVYVDSDEAGSKKASQRPRSLPFQIVTEESAKLISDSVGSGLDVMNSMTHLVAEHVESFAESTQNTLGSQFRLIRDSLGKTALETLNV